MATKLNPDAIQDRSIAAIKLQDGVVPSESTVSGWGFTKNTGTITGITMNGVSKGTSGVVDLGTVVTDVSGKADSSAAIGTLSLSINSTNYQITLSGTKVNGTTFTVSDVIDLPLESVVVSGSYDDNTKKVVLTLQNGSTVDFSVADLVAGLQSEITSSNKLSADLVEDGTTNKVVTATEKQTWNSYANVQADWNQATTTSDDYIKNKPAVKAGTGTNSILEGDLTNNTASGANSHAEGTNTEAVGDFSHAEGMNTRATSHYSHAEGSLTVAIGNYSHAEGLGVRPSNYTIAPFKLISGSANTRTYYVDTLDGAYVGMILYYNGRYARVKQVVDDDDEYYIVTDNQQPSLNPDSAITGATTVYIVTSGSSGYGSHTEGAFNLAIGQTSHAEGYGNIVLNDSEHAQGQYNVSNQSNTTFGNAGNTIDSIGIGTSESTRKNAFEIMQNGDIYAYGVGSYNGTNPGASGVSTLQNIISNSGNVTGPSSSTGNNLAAFDGTTGKIIKDSGIATSTLSNLVHTTGTESITGTKTFTTNTNFRSGVSILNSSGTVGTYMISDTTNDGKLEFYAAQDDSAVQLQNIATPTNNTDAANKSYVDGQVATKYTKPSGGIPSTDLASAVQTSLGKADTALQSYTETDPIYSASAAAGITSSDITSWNGKYTKPSGGIPSTDLTSAVQTSLGKADTALQSYTETDPVFTASAAYGISSSDITNWNSKTSNTGTITGITMNGASKGTSGVVDLGTVVTSESDPIFTASAAYGISSSDITNWNGKTSNVGTITGITMNGASKGTSGVVNLGTVITSETALSKGTTTGNGNAVTDIDVSGHQITLTKGTTFLTEETDPVFGSSAAASITTSQINAWNAKVSANTGTLTIQKNGTQIGTFGANQATNETINVQVNELPTVTSSDNGKILMVVNGAWSLVTPVSIYSGSDSPNNNIGNNGDIYIQTS